MKILSFEIKKICRLFFQLSILFLVVSCNNIDETTITDIEAESEVMLTDAWICDMESFEEDYWHYELYVKENGDYIAISDTRLLSVSKDGFINSIILLTYPDENPDVIRIYNNKIYRFHQNNSFQDFDPAESLKLQIYDFDFNLISAHDLDSNGLIYDVEVESDNLFGMLVYTPDDSNMKIKKIDLNSGLLSENTLSTTGTNPTNLHILGNGDYLCTASSSNNNLFYLDSNLNLVWADEINDYLIHDAKYIAGQGIYIAGRVSFFSTIPGTAYVSLLDLDGNIINSTSWDADERRSPSMQINDEKICIVQVEPESSKNMLFTLLDYDLNIESAIDIPGNYVTSDIVVNENGSFSFVYGIAVDPESTEFFPPSNTRIFKFDNSYTVPTNIIIQ